MLRVVEAELIERAVPVSWLLLRLKIRSNNTFGLGAGMYGTPASEILVEAYSVPLVDHDGSITHLDILFFGLIVIFFDVEEVIPLLLVFLLFQIRRPLLTLFILI